MAFWANDPGTLPGMPGPNETARASELNVYLEWSSTEDGQGKGSEGKPPKARSLFLGQLPDDQPDEVWMDGGPHSEGFERPVIFETELVEPVEVPDGVSDPSWEPVVDEPIGDATAPVPSLATAAVAPVTSAAVPPVGGREARRAARNKRARVRRSLVVAVAGIVTTFVAGTGVYVGTQAKAGDAGARRPTSTSFERQSTPTTAATVGASDVAPAAEPAPASDPASGSAAPAYPGAPRGTSPSQTGPAGAGGGPAAASQPAPGSTGAPPSSDSPPSSPPRTPTCQLLPVVCP